MTAAILVLLLAGAPGDPAPVLQSGELAAGSGQPSLEAAASHFARLWAAGESSALSGLVADGGVRLYLERASRSPLPARQAAAALRDYFAGHRPGEARLGRVSDVGGLPARGFAEVIWHAAAAGTTETTTLTVYVGFVRNEGDGNDGRWMVDEIRVMPGRE